MHSLVLIAVFVGNLTTTSYRSVPQSTDSTPYNTSTGEHVSISGAAISQDLLCGACRKLHKRCAHPEYNKKLHYGDTLYIDGVGTRIINDCMGVWKHYSVLTSKGKKILKIKQNTWTDIWVISYAEEHKFYIKYGSKKRSVWKINVVQNVKK